VRKLTYDPSSDSWASVTFAGDQNDDYTANMCVFNDRLFMIYQETGGAGLVKISEFTGGAWVDTGIASLGTGSGSDDNEKRHCLFTNVAGTEMIAIHTVDAGTDEGWRAWSFDTSLTPTDRTSTMLPAAFVATDDGGSRTGVMETERFWPFADSVTTAGSVTTYLTHAANATPGTGTTTYQFNGTGSVITSVDTGGDVAHSFPSTNSSGGEYVWTPGQNDVLVTAILSDSGGYILTLKGTGGGTGKVIRIYYSKTGGPERTLGTLTTPVTGGSASISAGTLIGVAADGTTEYTVKWDMEADSIASGERVQGYIRISNS
jgi:hypothetical protein